MEFSDEEIKELGEPTLRSHIKALIEMIQGWSDVNRFREKWKKKKEKDKTNE